MQMHICHMQTANMPCVHLSSYQGPAQLALHVTHVSVHQFMSMSEPTQMHPGAISGVLEYLFTCNLA